MGEEEARADAMEHVTFEERESSGEKQKQLIAEEIQKSLNESRERLPEIYIS